MQVAISFPYDKQQRQVPKKTGGVFMNRVLTYGGPNKPVSLWRQMSLAGQVLETMENKIRQCENCQCCVMLE